MAQPRQIILTKEIIDRYYELFPLYMRKGEDECWEWFHSKATRGYGQFMVKGRNYLAHRIAWMIANQINNHCGVILHECDNPPCQNPKHLFAGSHLDNMRDKVKKGRQPSNEKCARSKLRNVDIPVIRQRLKNGESERSIAKDYLVSHTIIGGIGRGEIWKSV